MNRWRPSKELLDLIEETKRLYGMLDKINEERIRYGWWKNHWAVEQMAYDREREVYRTIKDIIVSYVNNYE